MGDYATTTSLSLLLPNVLQGNTTTSDPDTAAIFGKFVTQAEGDINAAASKWYSLPFSTIPPAITSITERLALYRFIRGVYTQDGQIRQAYLGDYEAAMEELERLKKGEIYLVLTNGSEVTRKSNNFFRSSTENYSSSVFDLDEPEAWEVDDDRLTDITDGRV